MELLPESAEMAAGEPKYEPDEVRTIKQGAVHVYSNDHSFKSAAGVAWVTTSRVIWALDGNARSIRLSNLIGAESEGGGLFGFGVVSTPKLVLTHRTGKNGAQTKMQLAFKDGGRDDFLARINEALKLRKWEVFEAPKFATVGGGVGGIRARAKHEVAHTSETMDSAFSDLDGLMSKAKEMVELANRVAQIKKSDDDDDDSFGAMMASAGIDNPVTRESAGSAYHKELAQQLAQWLEKPLNEAHGVMTLADVYCVYNAARGLGGMVSPDDLVRACKSFKSLGISLCVRKLKSGVTVIESAMAQDSSVDARLKEALAARGSLGNMSAEEYAREYSISLYIAKEQLEAAEGRGVLARDDSLQGIRFYENQFLREE